MTHPTLRPLNVLLEQAERDRDEALARLGAADAAVNAARAQESALSSYRGETQDRWGAQLRSGMAMTLVGVYHDFIGRLHGAVEQLDVRVEHLLADVQRCQADVVACELRVASVRKLIERRQATLQRHADRSERRQEDEFASRVVWQRQPDEGPSASVK